MTVAIELRDVVDLWTDTLAADSSMKSFWSKSGPHDVDAISNVAGNTWKYTCDDTPTLTGLVGYTLVVSGATNAGNNGQFVITAVDDTPGAKFFTVTNAAGVVEPASPAAFTIYEKIKIRVGLNEKKPLTEADAPFIQVIPQTTMHGDTDSVYSWGIDLDFGITDSTFSDYRSKGRDEQEAFFKLDEFVELARKAISGISGKNLVLDGWSYLIRYEFFPLLVAQVSAEARLDNTLGVLGVDL